MVGVPAGFDELEGDVDDCLIVQELAAQKPVSAVETYQVGADVSNLPVTIEVSEIDVVSPTADFCARAKW